MSESAEARSQNTPTGFWRITHREQEKHTEATDAHGAPNTAISNQSRIKVHTHARTHTHCFFEQCFQSTPWPLFCLQWHLSYLTSAEIQAYGNARTHTHITHTHTHTHTGKTPRNSQEAELVLEFSPKTPLNDVRGLKIQSLQKMDRLAYPWWPVPVSHWCSAPGEHRLRSHAEKTSDMNCRCGVISVFTVWKKKLEN